MHRRDAATLPAAAVLLLLAACGADDASSTPASTTGRPTTAVASTESVAALQRFPDIVGATATREDGTGAWSFSVTVSSPYDTPERYADGWRIVGPDGTVYGTHTLAHDHAGEQPFTRRQTGVMIPAQVEEVTIEGRDQEYGFGGVTVTISLQTG